MACLGLLQGLLLFYYTTETNTKCLCMTSVAEERSSSLQTREGQDDELASLAGTVCLTVAGVGLVGTGFSQQSNRSFHLELPILKARGSTEVGVGGLGV